MSYIPKNNELIFTLVPNEPEEKPEICMVIRQATNNDKVRYMERLKTMLGGHEEFKEESVTSFLANPFVFMCLYGDEIQLVDSDYILGPAREESSDSSILTHATSHV